MGLKERFYPETTYGGFSYVDGTVAFYSKVNALVDPNSVVVDFGCGRGAGLDDPSTFRRNLRILKGKVKKVIGLDVDKAVLGNQAVDQPYLLTSSQWPLEDRSVDLVISDHVLEHLPEPALFFKESARVLKPGGFLCIRTPNKWSYIGIAARLIPNKFHSRVVGVAQEDRKEEDVFPTLYRCNSIGAIKRAFHDGGFQNIVVTGYDAEPDYLTFSSFAYWLGTLYGKFAPGWLKGAIFGFGRK